MKIGTKEDLKKELMAYHEHHIFYDCITDEDTIGSDDVRIWLDVDKEGFMPDVMMHYCRKCQCIMPFVSYNVGHKDVSTYELRTMIGDTPTVMYRKIYKCGCGREFATATIVMERVGYNLEYGMHPIQFEKYFDKEK